MNSYHSCQSFFFFNDTATTEIYTLSLHDALPIFADQHHEHGAETDAGAADVGGEAGHGRGDGGDEQRDRAGDRQPRDRKSTRLNSSHANISYAVFCLKKKNNYAHETKPRLTK